MGVSNRTAACICQTTATCWQNRASPPLAVRGTTGTRRRKRPTVHHSPTRVICPTTGMRVGKRLVLGARGSSKRQRNWFRLGAGPSNQDRRRRFLTSCAEEAAHDNSLADWNRDGGQPSLTDATGRAADTPMPWVRGRHHASAGYSSRLRIRYYREYPGVHDHSRRDSVIPTRKTFRNFSAQHC